MAFRTSNDEFSLLFEQSLSPVQDLTAGDTDAAISSVAVPNIPPSPEGPVWVTDLIGLEMYQPVAATGELNPGTGILSQPTPLNGIQRLTCLCLTEQACVDAWKHVFNPQLVEDDGDDEGRFDASVGQNQYPSCLTKMSTLMAIDPNIIWSRYEDFAGTFSQGTVTIPFPKSDVYAEVVDGETIDGVKNFSWDTDDSFTATVGYQSTTNINRGSDMPLTVDFQEENDTPPQILSG